MKIIQIITAILFAFILVLFFNKAYAGTSPGQSAVSGSNSAAGASINFEDSSRNTVIDRSFAPSSGNVTAHTQGRFTEIKGADVSFRPAEELIRFGMVWSESSLEALVAGGDVKYNFPIVNDYEKPGNMSYDGSRYIMIVTGQKAPSTFKISAPYDAEADDTDTNSFQVIGAIALKALRNGDNFIVVTHEGFNDQVFASGWGIGTHTVGSVVNESGKVSGTGGGGFGFSKNHTGEERMPWIRGYAGSVNHEEFNRIAIALDAGWMRTKSKSSVSSSGSKYKNVGR